MTPRRCPTSRYGTEYFGPSQETSSIGSVFFAILAFFEITCGFDTSAQNPSRAHLLVRIADEFAASGTTQRSVASVGVTFKADVRLQFFLQPILNITRGREISFPAANGEVFTENVIFMVGSSYGSSERDGMFWVSDGLAMETSGIPAIQRSHPRGLLNFHLTQPVKSITDVKLDIFTSPARLMCATVCVF